MPLLPHDLLRKAFQSLQQPDVRVPLLRDFYTPGIGRGGESFEIGRVPRNRPGGRHVAVREIGMDFALEES